MSQVLIPYVVLHALNILLLKAAAFVGASTPNTVFLRGLGCLLVGGAVALWNRRSMWPRHPREQAVRFIVAGASLYLLTESFHYARGTTVSTISRLDTALLIALGPLVGIANSGARRMVAVGLIATVAWLGYFGRGTEESLLGYGLALAATCGLTLGFVLMRRTGRKETVEVVAGVAALALITYGTLGGAKPTIEQHAQLGSLFALASGACMFAIYALTLRLYRVMNIALAEYPTLFSTILVLPLEQWVFGIPFDVGYSLIVLAQIVVLGLLLTPPQFWSSIRSQSAASN